MTTDSIVFPPMDESTFADKLARWQKRIPKKFKPATAYFRPGMKRIDVDKFTSHIESVTRGRFASRKARGNVNRDDYWQSRAKED